MDDEEVRTALREVYHKVKGAEQGIVLESLTRSGDVDVLMEALDPGSPVELILKATQIACDLKVENALGPLIDLLESQDSRVRVGAFVALSQFTNMNFDFDPYSSSKDRARAIVEWRRWFEMWSENQDL